MHANIGGDGVNVIVGIQGSAMRLTERPLTSHIGSALGFAVALKANETVPGEGEEMTGSEKVELAWGLCYCDPYR